MTSKGSLGFACILMLAAACTSETGEPGTSEKPKLTARLSLPDPPQLNIAKSGEDCPAYEQEELKEPVEIQPVDGVLGTQLVVAMRDHCVPVFEKIGGWTLQRLSLRTYGYPRDHSIPITAEMVQHDLDNPDIVWTAPGPTFVLHKATAPEANDGTNYQMTLFNALEPQEDSHACDELQKLKPPQGPFQPATAPPNCFHGDNSTNFHFHGFHVSPQPHQDFVGLELLPFGAAMPDHAVHERGEAVIGEYRFNVDRLRYTQSEGTHWYHAHKHGSTALQVLNGLVGTFKILGEFDAELEALFADQGGLPDRLLVVQQLQEAPSGLGNDPSGAPDPLINGMANPILRMKPGEIQRWRFVGATMQASAQLEIGFSGEGSPEVRQIAMDGVQFAPENYKCQPILRGPDCKSGTGDDSFKELNALKLDPGDRIDLLVKAPETAGRYVMTFKMVGVVHEDVAKDFAERNAAKIKAFLEDAVNQAVTTVNPPLLTVVVDEGPSLGTPFPTPEQFPRMPANLADLEGPFLSRTVAYQMADMRNLKNVNFSICDAAYDPSCVNETLTLDVEEEWTLTNNSVVHHPFHIHTNPFQLISDGKLVYNPPYLWRDVIAIDAGTPIKLGKTVIRYVGREFTGEFVNHCHILGHEDRGMMHNVQTVCPNGDWGKPTSDLSPECRDGNYISAAPICEEGTCDVVE
jgi:FtsP/CotA-like multicopper oxidase with cupredoxin domain